MIESRFLRRFPGWTPETLYAQEPDWIEDELIIMDLEAVADAQRAKESRG